MREKKSMKKISDAPYRAVLARKNKANHLKEVAKAIPDKDLFAVNTDKDGLREKREKLAKDRFKRKNTDGILKSKTEVALLKKLEKKGPPIPIKPEVEFFDVWGDSGSNLSKKVQKYKDFSKKSLTKVKAIVTPLAGQSVNPSLQSHREVLKKVVNEEEREIEEEYRGSMAQSLHTAAVALEQLKAKQAEREAKAAAMAANAKNKPEVEEESEGSEEEDDSESEGEKGFKPVDRLKKLTVNQRNQKKERKERNLAQQQRALERREQRQYDKVQVFVNEDIRENKISRENIRKREEAAAAEKRRQMEDGVVTKATKVGRKAYQMKKTDFQLEDELAGSLREARPLGKDDFLRDRFDSVYRRNLLDVVDKVHESEKIRKRKNGFKFKARSGGVYSSVTEKLDKKNKKTKAKLDMKEKKQGFLQDDLIML